jgi:two-component system, chemotaxis family, chemotaxis protein CheY
VIILIVDDSRAMRSIITRTIVKAGFEGIDLFEAENGRHGVEQVEAVKPDMVLSDWNMPEQDGLEFLKAIRPSHPDLTFGFITSMGTNDMRDVAHEAGANFFIGKPFTVEMFSRQLGPYIDALGGRRQRVLGTKKMNRSFVAKLWEACKRGFIAPNLKRSE